MGALLSSCFKGSSVVEIGAYRCQFGKQIGEGNYSFVYQVTEQTTGAAFACKRILAQDAEQLQAAHFEIRVCRSFSHPNLIPLLECTSVLSETNDHASTILLLFPLHSNGTVQDGIDRFKLAGSPTFYSEKHCRRIIRGVCAGIAAFHAHDPAWCHRDIKPANVLLNADGEAVVCDFGSAGAARCTVNTKADANRLEDEIEAHTTPFFRAPELFNICAPSEVDERIDVWAIGCLFFAMAFGSSPFASKHAGSLALMTQGGAWRFPDQHQLSPGFCEIVRAALTVDRASRPHLSEIIALLDRP